jgi:hypothetical protein
VTPLFRKAMNKSGIFLPDLQKKNKKEVVQVIKETGKGSFSSRKI